MATASESASEPTTAGDELGLARRLREIEDIDGSSREGVSRLAALAKDSGEAPLRLAAVSRLFDLEVLGALQADPDPVTAASAKEQLCGILAGTIPSPFRESERFRYIRDLGEDMLVAVGRLTRHKPTADAVLACLDSVVCFLELAEHAKSVHTRKAAAMAIEDRELLTELLRKLQGREKTVSKAIRQKLESPAAVAQPPEGGDSVGSPSGSEAKPGEGNNVPPAEKERAPLADLESMQSELEKLGTRNTAQLTSLKRKLGKFAKLASAAPNLKSLFDGVQAQLQEKLRLNAHYQDQLRGNTEALLKTLEQALNEGRSDDALPAWDKIQGNISNTGGKVRAHLKKLANVHKATLVEMRDWKIFAATEKKKALIEQMRRLLESKMHAADRSRRISAMHGEWKALGRSNQNEELWLEFKKLSDEAYKPCKDYFQQRKELMAENLKQRRAICERIDREIQSLDRENPKIKALNKLIGEADKDWKKYAPVEQSKIKSLQKRYYGTLNELRKIRKMSLKHNSDQKKQCIARAEALAELEDRKQAMTEAKQLQREWKSIGPTTFKEDKSYWERFRAACDRIFDTGNRETTALSDDLEKTEQALKEILDDLDRIGAQEDEALRDNRGDYRELVNKFSSSFDPRLRKQGKSLQNRFNNLRSAIDARFKKLPDKKQQQQIQQVDAAVTLLQSWERELLDCKDQSQFNERRTVLDTSAWGKQDLPADEELRGLLRDRHAALSQSDSLEGYRNLAEQAVKSLRNLCVQLEIRAGIDSPQTDQDLRMQIQLEQLQRGFGQSRAPAQSQSKFARAMELESRCIGPLPNDLGNALSTRLRRALDKLL